MTAKDSQVERISRKLRFLLSNERMTIPMLAEYLEVSRATLQHVVDGQSMPPDALLRRLADYFGVPVSFFTGEPAPGKPAAGPGPSPGGAQAGKKPALNLKTLATRYQALVELLVSKGVITASEYQKAIEKTEGRQSTSRNR